MIGTLVTVGVGALAFKLGVNTQKRASKGKSGGDLVKDAVSDAAEIVGGAASSCCSAVRCGYEKISGLVGGCCTNKQK